MIQAKDYDDEFYFCMDTSMFIEGECPIVAIAVGGAAGERKRIYDTFGELLFEMVKIIDE